MYQVTNTSLPCRIMFVRSLEQSLVGTCVVDCNNFFCSRFFAVFSHPMSIGFCLFELVSQLRPTKMRYRLFETFATATAHDLCVLGRILNEKFDRVHYTTTSALSSPTILLTQITNSSLICDTCTNTYVIEYPDCSLW